MIRENLDETYEALLSATGKARINLKLVNTLIANGYHYNLTGQQVARIRESYSNLEKVLTSFEEIKLTAESSKIEFEQRFPPPS